MRKVSLRGLSLKPPELNQTVQMQKAMMTTIVMLMSMSMNLNIIDKLAAEDLKFSYHMLGI